MMLINSQVGLNVAFVVVVVVLGAWWLVVGGSMFKEFVYRKLYLPCSKIVFIQMLH